MSSYTRRALVALPLLLASVAGAQRAPDGLLTPARKRTNNEVFLADARVFATWQARLASAGVRAQALPPARREYLLAKADAWLTFAREEYAAEPRATASDEALAEAARLIMGIEQGEPTDDDTTPLVAGASRVRTDLWDALRTARAAGAFVRSAGDIARAEVALVRGGRPLIAGSRASALCPPGTYVARAEQLIQTVVARVVVPEPIVVAMVPVDTTPDAIVEAARIDSVAKAKMMPFVRSVHFALDKAELSAESRSLLDEIVGILAVSDETVLVLEGHTDPRGGSTYNLGLSELRARSVQRYLMEAKVRASRVEIRPYGFTQRGATGTTVLDYAIDRRVVLRFLALDNHVMTVGEVEAVDDHRDLQIETPAKDGRRRAGSRAAGASAGSGGAR